MLWLNYKYVVVRAEKQAFFPMKLKVYADQIFAIIPIRKKTLATYRSMFRCHVESALGNIYLNEITRSDIKTLISRLPPQTAAMTLAVIKMIFREAMEDGIVEKSPVHGLKGPRVMVAPRKFLTWEEIDRIHFGKWNHQVRFLALHGLRWRARKRICLLYFPKFLSLIWSHVRNFRGSTMMVWLLMPWAGE